MSFFSLQWSHGSLVGVSGVSMSPKDKMVISSLSISSARSLAADLQKTALSVRSGFLKKSWNGLDSEADPSNWEGEEAMVSSLYLCETPGFCFLTSWNWAPWNCPLLRESTSMSLTWNSTTFKRRFWDHVFLRFVFPGLVSHAPFCSKLQKTKKTKWGGNQLRKPKMRTDKGWPIVFLVPQKWIFLFGDLDD